MYFKGRKSNYDKHPYLEIDHMEKEAFADIDTIAEELKRKIKNIEKPKRLIVFDYYHGIQRSEIEEIIEKIQPDVKMFCERAKLPEEQLRRKLEHNITDDRVFGVLGTQVMRDFYDEPEMEKLCRQIREYQQGVIVVYGIGAALFAEKADLLIYGDINRWEIQLRYRSGELDNWGVGNYDEDILRKYKRGYFVEWRMLDRHKAELFDRIDYFLDMNHKNDYEKGAG